MRILPLLKTFLLCGAALLSLACGTLPCVLSVTLFTQADVASEITPVEASSQQKSSRSAPQRRVAFVASKGVFPRSAPLRSGGSDPQDATALENELEELDELELEYDRILSDWRVSFEDFLRSELELSESDIDFIETQNETLRESLDLQAREFELAPSEDERQQVFDTINAANHAYRKALEARFGPQLIEKMEDERRRFNAEINTRFAGRIAVGMF